MNNKDRAAMQMALGALVRAEALYGQPNADIQTALREALAQPQVGSSKMETTTTPQISDYDREFWGDGQPHPPHRCCECEECVAYFVDSVCESSFHPETLAEQAEQEPVAWMWACTECGTEAEDGTDCRICSSCGYHKFYKAPKVATCVCAAKTQEQAEQEPVYAFRRRGLDDFCTCTKERYDELVDKPNLFEVTTFYAEPVGAEHFLKAIAALREGIATCRAEALEEAAKLCDDEQAQLEAMGLDDEAWAAWAAGYCARQIRGLK